MDTWVDAGCECMLPASGKTLVAHIHKIACSRFCARSEYGKKNSQTITTMPRLLKD